MCGSFHEWNPTPIILWEFSAELKTNPLRWKYHPLKKKPLENLTLMNVPKSQFLRKSYQSYQGPTIKKKALRKTSRKLSKCLCLWLAGTNRFRKSARGWSSLFAQWRTQTALNRFLFLTDFFLCWLTRKSNAKLWEQSCCFFFRPDFPLFWSTPNSNANYDNNLADSFDT